MNASRSRVCTPKKARPQPPQEAFAEEAVVAERAQAREERHRHGESEHVGGQVTAHGHIGPTDHGLRLVEVAEVHDELGAP